MLISVIVPHLNQPAYLAVGLAALNAQAGVKSDVEIIVVDNGSSSLPEEICLPWSNVRLIAESEPGPGPARNRGAASARGELLAFIDADCEADANWLAAIEHAFSNGDVQVIGGDVRTRYVNLAKPKFHEPYEAIYSYRNDEHIAEGFSGTGNLAMRPEVLLRVGAFGGINIAEDRDWGLRAGALGYAIRYIPEMIVYHPPRPSFADLILKWDRHISHDYAEVSGFGGRVRWLARAVAIAASPIVELPRVSTSKRVKGVWERMLAFACLARIRFYRTWRMLGLLVAGSGDKYASSWNRR